MKKTYTLCWGNHQLTMGSRALVMGILNVTPDSFSDGGRFLAAGSALAQARQMVAAGADIIDIGGESTRPFSEPVSEAEEINRTVPVIAQLAEEINVPISIDTTKSGVAAAALAAGASIINDVSALRTDPEIAALAAQAGVPVILMHMQGTPKTMQENPTYENVTQEVMDFLDDAAKTAEKAGVDPKNIIVDPGIGFGKTVAHNYTLIKNIDQLASLGRPVLIGPSRKAFIRKTLSVGLDHEIAPDSVFAETGTQAIVAAAIMGGAHIVRVHNVANTAVTVNIIDALNTQGESHAAGH